jgi:hypothetical protein
MMIKTAATRETDSQKRVCRPEAAAKIASLIEDHMTECGFTEKQKK